jgi:kynurenine 3-monooxygenase
MVKHVAIVGAGPCGVLLAHYLLRRQEPYIIDLYERRSDPRQVSFSKTRTYPLSLTERGMSALRPIEGLESAVKAESVEIIGSVFHQKDGKTRSRSRKSFVYAIDRTKLATILLEQLTHRYDTNRVNLHFNCTCTQVNFAENTLHLQNETEFRVNYDRLVAADGAGSTLRQYLLNTELFEYSQKYIPADYKSIFLPALADSSSSLAKPGNIHYWQLDNGTAIILLHQVDQTLSGVILFPRNQNPTASLTSPDQVVQFFRQNVPEIEHLMPEEEAKAFIERPLARILTVKCSRLHQGDRVLLLGDAAHSASPSIGQGCNAAFEDVVVFDQVLSEMNDDWAKVLPEYTQRRIPDVHALVDLANYAVPTSGPATLLVEFNLREAIAKGLHRLRPQQFPPSLFQLISETTGSNAKRDKMQELR